MLRLAGREGRRSRERSGASGRTGNRARGRGIHACGIRVNPQPAAGAVPMSAADPPLPSTLPSADAGPVRPEERLLALDVLRGIALLGVLVANVWFWFSGLFLHMAEFRPELSRATLDSAAFHLVAVFVSGKAISVFSFLFGLGLAVQAMRAEARGGEVAPLYRRRMAVLLAIGAVHGVLLWYGDILMVYALLGFVLLFFRRRSDRTLLAGAAVLLVAVPLAWTAWSMLGHGGGGTASSAAERAATLEALRSGLPSRIIPVNVQRIREMYFGPLAVQIFPSILGLFLLGLWAGRRRVFARVPAHAAAFRRVMIWGFGVGLTASIAFEVLRTVLTGQAGARPWLAPVMSVLRLLAVVPLAAGYVSATVLLLERPAWRARLAVFAPVGRMALTNYLSQTVICLVIFYGGGLVGGIGPAAAVGIALAVFAVQMAWSPWWLARFRFGPMEWLWRSLTYGRLQPMRIRAPAVQPGLTV
jgi:uncharacterized protein